MATPSVAEVATLAARGLSSAEAVAALRRFGPNRVAVRDSHGPLRQLAERLRDPLVLLLVAASILSAWSGEIANFWLINAIVVLSVALDFGQTWRASRAAARLAETVAVRSTVIRDGRRVDIATSEIVPGEWVALTAGDLVPADAVVVQAHDFFVKQAALTGEPYPIEKRPAAPEAVVAAPLQGPLETDVAAAADRVFLGTSVVTGTAVVRVMRTGAATQFGHVAASLSRPHTPGSLEQGVRQFGLLVLRLTVLLVLAVLLLSLWQQRPWLEAFLFALALAVGLTPELLPMVVSVSLARGAMRLAQRQVIVKRLAALEELGAMDVLCTDKTGTLTEARVALVAHVDAEGRTSERVLELAWLNAHFETGLKSPLDEAIVQHAVGDAAQWRKLDEVAFDFERRRISVLVEHIVSGRRLLVVKGAADEITALCSSCDQGEGGRVALDAPRREALRAHWHALEEQGLRVLAVAWRAVEAGRAHAQTDDEEQLVLAGFAAFADPPKAGVATALGDLSRLGVGLKIVTGDSDRVTRHLCAQLGIAVQGVLTGRELAVLDDHALAARVDQVNLYCRVNPAQKERIIRALRTRRHVVGYLGDGINDAPPLHAAHVGMSVQGAADVAREASDLVLVGHDLAVLHAAVREGRRTTANIGKYMLMGTSSNFGNMFSMAAAAAFLPFLPMLPTQILLNNLLYDLSELPVPLDRVEEDELRAPQRLDIGQVRTFMLVIGPVSSLFDLLTFWLLLHVLHADAQQFHSGWFVESLVTQSLVIFVIRTHRPLWQSRPHPLLVATSLGVSACALALPWTAVGQWFGLVPLPALFYALLAAIVLVYLGLVAWVRQLFSRRLARHHRRPDVA